MKNKLKKNLDLIAFLISFSLFYIVFGHTIYFDQTYDDFMLENKFFSSPGDAKLYSTILYADFHFYPIYFLSHEIDKFISYSISFFIKPIPITIIQKNTNIILHIFNTYLLYEILKILFSPKKFTQTFVIFISSLVFLFHPIGSQVVFNITTRNESLALFFSFLTFYYSFKFFRQKRIIDLFFIFTLYFFALSSKLIAVTFIAIIPLAILFVEFKKDILFKNYKKIIPITSYLILTFLIFYFIRDQFINKYNLTFYSDIYDIVNNFFTGFKFYLRGLVYPFEHIYVYADNYNQENKMLVFLIFVIISLISLIYYFKFKDPLLFFSIFWLVATLSMPLLFNLIEKGFPLNSKLAERYQYFSIPALSIFLAWISIKTANIKYLKTFPILFVVLLIVFFGFIKLDRSKVYVDNRVFFYKAYENSPENHHPFFFAVPMKDAIVENNTSKYLFNLYQLFNLYPKDSAFIFQFMKYFTLTNNRAAYKYFLNYYKTNTIYDPPLKFKLAQYLFRSNDYDEASRVIDEIFKDFDQLIEEFKLNKKRIIISNPEIDDVYFLKGLILHKQKKYKDALGNFMLATLHNPMHATALYNSSIILKQLGQNELAKKHFEDAIKINPFLRETIIHNFIKDEDFKK